MIKVYRAVSHMATFTGYSWQCRLQDHFIQRQPQQLPRCPVLLLWCPLQSTNTNLKFLHGSASYHRKIAMALQEQSSRPGHKILQNNFRRFQRIKLTCECVFFLEIAWNWLPVNCPVWHGPLDGTKFAIKLISYCKSIAWTDVCSSDQFIDFKADHRCSGREE